MLHVYGWYVVHCVKPPVAHKNHLLAAVVLRNCLAVAHITLALLVTQSLEASEVP